MLTHTLTACLFGLLAGGLECPDWAPKREDRCVSEHHTYRLGIVEATQGEEVELTIQMDLNPDADSRIDPVQAYEVAICHDPSELTAAGWQETEDLGGAGARFSPAINEIRLHDNGLTQGVVLDLFGPLAIPPELGFRSAVIAYEVLADPGTHIELSFCNGLVGTPPLENSVVIGGNSFLAQSEPGAILVRAPFVRGDTAAPKGNLDLQDAMAILRFVFADGRLACEDAGDVNDNGRLELADAVLLLQFVFLMGAPPQPPFPEPGLDPMPDQIGCEEL